VELLSNISALIRERLKFRDTLATLTAESKMSAKMLAGMPFVMFSALMLINPEYMRPLLTQPLGKALLGYAILSVMLGYIILDRIASVDL
jgi:tight adherence protein B